MQITHEEARKLIQFNIDQSLKLPEKNILFEHLEACVECREYAKDLKEVESLLSPIMKREWNLHPAPLSIEAIAHKRNSQLQMNNMLVTRTMIMSVIFATFIFVVWQFTQPGQQASNQLPAGVLPVPTPSSLSTSTKINFPNCEERIYQVQENDTLESIAYQFSISKDKIMSINNMKTETVAAKMELLIPICNSTPTGTVHPSTLTTTFTPLTSPITSTPGG